MNLDSTQDFIKQHGNINLIDEDIIYKPLFCVVDENKKPMLVVEYETVLFVDSPREIEIKKLGFLEVKNYTISNPDQITKKFFGSDIFNMKKLNVSKLTFDQKVYKQVSETSDLMFLKLSDTIEDVIVSSLKISPVNLLKSYEVITDELTMFGQLMFVKHVFDDRRERIHERALDGKKEKTVGLFQRYLFLLEEYFCQISTINMLKTEDGRYKRRISNDVKSHESIVGCTM